MARPVFFVEFRRLFRKHGADDFRWALTGREYDVAGEVKRRIFLVIAYLLFHFSLGQAKHDTPYACPIDRARTHGAWLRGCVHRASGKKIQTIGFAGARGEKPLRVGRAVATFRTVAIALFQ